MGRDYRSEYANYHSSDKQKKNRASRNAARAKMLKSGRVKKGDGKDVTHRNGNPRDNSKNRSYKRTKRAKKAQIH